MKRQKTMTRLISILVLLLLVFNLSACSTIVQPSGGKPAKESNTKSESGEQTQSSDNQTQSSNEQSQSSNITDTSTRFLNNQFDKINIERDIEYGESINSEGAKQKLLLDIYQPEGDSENLRPAIIWVHGGGFMYAFGRKESGLERILAEDFAKKGYVCISIEYRLRNAPVDDWAGALKDAVEDASKALDWVVENSLKYKIDPRYISMGGHSSGGIISSNLCYNKDLSQMAKNKPFAIINMAGGVGVADLRKDNINDCKTPCLVIHGTMDQICGFESGKYFAQLLDENKIEYVFHPLEGAGHDFYDYYDEVSDSIASFLYKELTGKESNIKIRTGLDLTYEQEYKAKQINFKLDGKFDEWGNSNVIRLDKLKEAGSQIPSSDDFTGSAMIGWNPADPNRVYLAVQITDDILQDIHPADNLFWEDDSIEVYFDLSQPGKGSLIPLMPWIMGANGTEFCVLSNKDNTEIAFTKEGNTYYYELAINIPKAADGAPEECRQFSTVNGPIGLSVAYNDCENGTRENQMGWIEGPASFRKSFGKLMFEPILAK